MDKFTVHTGLAAPLRRSDVDTDQIIPAEYLKRVSRTGFEDGLFSAWRADPAFVLNDPAYAGATILVAGARFGVGSSREHAVWALRDFGFRAVIAPSFGDIFRTNAVNTGLAPIALPAEQVATLRETVGVDNVLTVDLEQLTITNSCGLRIPFELDAHTQETLVHGLDDIARTLRREAEIDAYEATHSARVDTRALPV